MKSRTILVIFILFVLTFSLTYLYLTRYTYFLIRDINEIDCTDYYTNSSLNPFQVHSVSIGLGIFILVIFGALLDIILSKTKKLKYMIITVLIVFLVIFNYLFVNPSYKNWYSKSLDMLENKNEVDTVIVKVNEVNNSFWRLNQDWVDISFKPVNPNERVRINQFSIYDHYGYRKDEFKKGDKLIIIQNKINSKIFKILDYSRNYIRL